MVAKSDMKIEDLNKFEKTRLFSARAAEIANGAEPKIDLEKEGFKKPILSRDYVRVAEIEFEKNLLDLELYK